MQDGDNWGLAQVWNESLDTDRQRPLEKREHVWASELGKSYYDRYYKMQGRTATTPPNMRARRKFEAGNLMEWVVTQVLTRAGVLHTTQDYIVCDEGDVRVTGKNDFMAGGKIQDVNLDDLPDTFAMVAEAAVTALKNKFPNGIRDQGLELKSCSAFIFEKYLKAPGEHHALQAFHYAYNTKKPFILVYICRDDLRVCEWVILPDNQKLKRKYFDDLVGMRNVLDAAEKGVMPEKEPLLLYDEKEQRFSKNWEVEYSLYLTDYGFERPDEYADALGGHVTHLNSVIKRHREAKKFTEKNLDWIEEGIAFDPQVADILERLNIKGREKA